MMNVIEFKILLAQVDAMLDQCRPEEPAPGRNATQASGPCVRHQGLLRQAADEITEGLATFPFNPQLLRRRAWARAQIVTSDGVRPEVHLAVEDLQLLLELDPNDFTTAVELLQEMHRAGGMPNSAVLQVASELASRTEDLLIRTRILQMRALLAEGDSASAQQLYDVTFRTFSDSSKLRLFQSELGTAAQGSLRDNS